MISSVQTPIRQRRLYPRSNALICALLAVLSTDAVRATAVGATSSLRAVALSGAAPARFDQLRGSPSIDDEGRIAFLTGTRESQGATGVWIAEGESLRPIATAGMIAPGARAPFVSFADLVLASGGSIAFRGEAAGLSQTKTRSGIWLGDHTDLQDVALAGDVAPGPTGGRRFAVFETPVALGPQGHVAHFARMTEKEHEGVLDSGAWMGGAVTALVAAPDVLAAPGEPSTFSPQSFEAPFAEDPVVSPTGQTIFRAFLEGPTITALNGNGLWSHSPERGLEMLLRAGDPAPDTGGARFVSFPSVPTVNAAGDVAFTAFYASEQSREDGQLGFGLWVRDAAGRLDTVLKAQAPTPADVGRAWFADVFDPVLNAAGDVAFVAAIDGEGVTEHDELTLWSNARSASGVLELVARQGDIAPSPSVDLRFSQFLDPSLNAAGQAAFMAVAYETDEGRVVAGGLGLWGQGRDGALRLVVHEGQLVEVAPGDWREVSGVGFTSGSGGEDGRARGLSDSGLVAVRLDFTDGSSGVFVSTALTVPAPASLPMVEIGVMSGLGVCTLRRGCGRRCHNEPLN